MRSNPMKASSWATLLVLGAAGVTACGQGLTDSASRHSRVVLSVRSLLGAVILLAIVNLFRRGSVR